MLALLSGEVVRRGVSAVDERTWWARMVYMNIFRPRPLNKNVKKKPESLLNSLKQR